MTTAAEPIRVPSPDAGYSRSLRFAITIAVLHVLLLMVYLFGTWYFGGRCEQIFRDFGVVLPASTSFLLGVARWLNNYWYVLVFWFFIALAVDGGILYGLHRSRRTLSYLWAFLPILLILFAAAYTAISLYRPYSELMENLSR